GIAPRTAQAAMRHSKIDLTMTVYTDPKLLDVRGALDVLPALPLDGTGLEAARATGTDGGAGKFAPKFAPTRCKPVQTETTSDNLKGKNDDSKQAETAAVSGCPDKRRHPPTVAVSGCQGVGATGLEPVTPSVSKGLPPPPESLETLVKKRVYILSWALASTVVNVRGLARNRGSSAARVWCAEEARKRRIRGCLPIGELPPGTAYCAGAGPAVSP